MLKAVGAVMLAALLLAYGSVCLFVYLTGWQNLIHPSSTVERTPASESLPFEPVHFDAAATGRPRLTGWWIPANPSPDGTPTILYLHDASGSLSDTVHTLALLHGAHVNLFAIDYRGFGHSDPPHPTQRRMTEDTSASLDYLINTRHLNPVTVVPYGLGLGSYLAANLALTHPELPVMVLDHPVLNKSRSAAENNVGQGGRSRLLPMHLLIEDRFEVETPLLSLRQPRLLICSGPNALKSDNGSPEALLRSAANPGMILTIPKEAEAQYVEGVSRFLDEYMATSARKEQPR